MAKSTQKKTTPSYLDTVMSLGEEAFTSLARTKYGWIAYNKHDQYIGGSIERYGEFSEGEVDCFRQILNPGDFVVEAGANIGTHTVVFSQMVGNMGRVFAYEPQRYVFQNLCANISLNSIMNVQVFQAALGPEPSEILVPLLEPNTSNNFGALSIQGHESGEKIPVTTIDSLGLPRCNLIKIDVEGMEHEVLSGAKDTIKRLRPVMYVENDRRAKSEALINLLWSMDYRLWWHLTPLYNPSNYKNNPENVFGNIVSVNMLCLPKEAIANIDFPEITSAQADWRALVKL